VTRVSRELQVYDYGIVNVSAYRLSRYLRDGVINVRADFDGDKGHKQRHKLDHWENGGAIWSVVCGRWGVSFGDLVQKPSRPYALCPQCFTVATVPHPIEACYGSRLHCHHHDVDEPERNAYRGCLECGHSFQTPRELLVAYKIATRALRDPSEPWPDAANVPACPYCCHDW
jgi:hypothetical protein